MFDVRFLARRKALTGIAVLTMGLAIGATTAALSVLEAFLRSSLGVPNADRVVVVQPERNLPGRGAVQFADAYPNYLLLRQLQHSFADVAATIPLSVSWNDHGESRQLSAARVTATFSSAFGVQPMLGRTFLAKEEGPSPAPVVMVSHGFWTTSLGADRDIIGKTLSINGAPHTVVAVMPRSFTQPSSIDVWLPFDIPQSQRTAITGARQLTLFARLSNGTTIDAARRDMASFSARAIEASPADNNDYRYSVTTIRDNLLNGADSTARFVLAGAGGLLLLAVLNLSSLLLAWGFERRQELAVRVALGAGASRVMRLVFQQSLIIVLAGAVVGTALSFGALRLLQGFDLGATVSPFIAAAHLDLTVLGVTIMLTVIAGVLAGLLPVWFTRDTNVGDALRSSSRSSTASRGALGWQKAMVFGQAALSVVILAAAALLGVSFWRLSEVPNGFTSGNKIVARVVLPDLTYGAHRARAAFARALSANLAAEPSLVSSGFTTTLPVGDTPSGSRLFVELPDGSMTREPILFHSRRISPSYFTAMGIPLLRGRAFTMQDDTGSVAVAVVSRALAERLWPAESPIGKRLERPATAAGASAQTALTVVGEVGNTMDGGYGAPAGETVYVPYLQNSNAHVSIVAEGRGSAGVTARAVRHALQATDAVVAAGTVSTLDALVLQANALPRLRTLVLLVFAIVAVGIVALGSYSVMSQLVISRERELAVRLVFGARPDRLAGSVLIQIARIVIPGIVLGLLATRVLSGALATFLFGVTATSFSVLGLSGGVLVLLSIVATFPAALRVLRLDVRRGIERET